MALRRVDRDLPALTVLALLTTGPRHTYEMHRLMVDTHKDFVTGLPRSMYHAVDRLLRAGLIEVVRTDRAEGRPERTVYGLTDAGRAELRERVRRLLEHPDPDATLFVAALSFLGCLPVPQARAAPVEPERELARRPPERDWVAGLLGDVDAGRGGGADDIRDLEVGHVTWTRGPGGRGWLAGARAGVPLRRPRPRETGTAPVSVRR